MIIGEVAEDALRAPVGELYELADRLLVGIGARGSDAALVADCLLYADRRGVASHGLVRLPSYAAQVRAGEIDPHAEPQLREDDGPVSHVEANRSFGAVSSELAMRSAIERAFDHGIGAVTVRGGNHFGAAAYYTQRAARSGLIGITATNTPAVMAPWGAAEPLLGNNPLSVAAPTADQDRPFVLDLAFTNVARGRIKLAEETGESLPEGWALGPDGKSTTDPSAALAGALLPFGGYKGSALAMAVEILSAVTSGSALSHELDNTGMTGQVEPGPGARTGGVGVLHVAIRPTSFGADPSFPERVAALAEVVETARPAPEFGSPPAVPGFKEASAAERADGEGVPVHPATARGLVALADELEIEVPERLRVAAELGRGPRREP